MFTVGDEEMRRTTPTIGVIFSIVGLVLRNGPAMVPPPPPPPLPSLSRPHACAPPAPGKLPNLTICVQVKDEVAYLAEWIEFYRLAGPVQRFVIYDDGSSDNVQQLPALFKLRRGFDGVIVRSALPRHRLLHDSLGTCRDFPACQSLSYMRCVEEFGGGSGSGSGERTVEWMLGVDADEFIFAPSACDTIASWLQRAMVAEPRIGSFRVHCLRYGANGQAQRFGWHLATPMSQRGMVLANDAMELLVGSHVRRGPSPWGHGGAAERSMHDACEAMAPQSALSAGMPLGLGHNLSDNGFGSEREAREATAACPYVECRDACEPAFLGRAVCSQSAREEPGKSLFRGDRCAVPGIHYCVGAAEGTRRWADVHAELRCNHYYIRSEQDVAIKAGWHARAQRFVPAVAKCRRFWNSVEDRAILDAHPGLLQALHSAMGALAGGVAMPPVHVHHQS